MRQWIRDNTFTSIKLQIVSESSILDLSLNTFNGHFLKPSISFMFKRTVRIEHKVVDVEAEEQNMEYNQENYKQLPSPRYGSLLHLCLWEGISFEEVKHVVYYLRSKLSANITKDVFTS